MRVVVGGGGKRKKGHYTPRATKQTTGLAKRNTGRIYLHTHMVTRAHNKPMGLVCKTSRHAQICELGVRFVNLLYCRFVLYEALLFLVFVLMIHLYCTYMASLYTFYMWSCASGKHVL